MNSGRPRSGGQLLEEDDRGEKAADLHDEHHRVLDLDSRVELPNESMTACRTMPGSQIEILRACSDMVVS